MNDEYTAKFWYKRDGENRPIVTVCDLLDKDGNLVSYGMAICSPKDAPDKNYGRMIAERRARHALLKHRRPSHIGDITSLDIELAHDLAKKNRFYLYNTIR